MRTVLSFRSLGQRAAIQRAAIQRAAAQPVARRVARWAALPLLLLTACGEPAKTPAALAQQFYTVLEAAGIRRVPDGAQMLALRPYLTDSLAVALERARAERDSAIARDPNEKPPFADGDPFSSLFEGRTSAAPKSTIMRGDTALVVVAFTNDTQKPAVTWQDTLVVVTQRAQLVVADIRYGTTWEFGYRGRLLDQLRAEEP